MKISKVALSILNTKDYNTFFKIFKNEKMEYLHCDVMDGNFVPNINLMDSDYKKLVKNSPFKNDVHIMVSDPIKIVKKFAHYKANIITAHLEAFKTEKEILEFFNELIRRKIKIGLSIKPKTSFEKIKPYLEYLDLVLFMSVEPGKGGQKFMANSIKKIEKAFDYRKKFKLNYLIEVDGGINLGSLEKIPKEKVDLFVMGSYFTKSNDLNKSIKEVKNV